MDRNKLVSIILPVYNGEKFLATSIKSCLNQTYKNIELIIVNDCSTDNSLEIINGFSKLDNRIKVINNQKNLKLPASLNVGHEIAKGDFITWTSDDNFYEPIAIEELVKTLKVKDSDIAYSNVYMINNDGQRLREVNFLSIENLIFGNHIGSCFLYKKSVYKNNRGYNENLFLVEDYDFWLRALVHSKYTHVNKLLYNYRKHENSLTNQIHVDTEKFNLYRENLKTMYANFWELICSKENTFITEFCLKVLTHQKINFKTVVLNHKSINAVQEDLMKNSNFSSISELKRVFLRQLIILIVNQKDGSNLSKILFVFRKYFFVLDMPSFKTLVKYSIR
ncbi:hypothetical protein BWZ22_01535 [Seonamhaeicola sp. S2-3]|uniref:glycosyltransferase family 2 protein n=1 Tax=Seonamhaeicola sp. S2-3 TaxID=1936081 RepID=UPI000972B9E4|nr:glycosyltransferase [Seonamhaeicola sp. S2-3]APY10005.1 hypothetical protein BWZ22_01535 [Seonamhaeicola sp. S2-3]